MEPGRKVSRSKEELISKFVHGFRGRARMGPVQKAYQTAQSSIRIREIRVQKSVELRVSQKGENVFQR